MGGLRYKGKIMNKHISLDISDENSQTKIKNFPQTNWEQEYKEIKKSKAYDRKTKKQMLKHAKKMIKKHKNVDF